MLFQSTHPARGATIHVFSPPYVGWNFNPRTPRGVRRRQRRRSNSQKPDFNPRTPRGVRRMASYCSSCHFHFNPRTPRGVRLDQSLSDSSQCQISIHAPREGCDFILTSSLPILSQFQSTHPARGATSPLHSTGRPSPYFNPRTPRGVRLLQTQERVLHNRIFQSTHPARGATVVAVFVV